MSDIEKTLISYWYAALSAPIGVLLSFSEGTFDHERAALYRARKKALDPQLMTLQIRLLPGNELAIVHREGLL